MEMGTLQAWGRLPHSMQHHHMLAPALHLWNSKAVKVPSHTDAVTADEQHTCLEPGILPSSQSAC